MQFIAFLPLACLLLVDVQGMALVSKDQCLCLDGGVQFIRPNNIMKIEVYSPSASCQNMEIIVTLKNKEEKKCLNPESQFSKNFIKNYLMKKGNLKGREH